MEIAFAKKRKNRRNKLPEQNRNFFCGCGKSYLSYPALYTHVKLKHQGIFPLGSSSKHQQEQNNNPDSHQSLQTFKQFQIKHLRFHQNLQGYQETNKDLITYQQLNEIIEPLRKNRYQFFEKYIDKLQISLLYDNEQLLEHQLLQNINLDIGAIAGFYLRNLWQYCSKDLFYEYLLLMYGLYLMDKHEEIINGAQYLALVKKKSAIPLLQIDFHNLQRL